VPGGVVHVRHPQCVEVIEALRRADGSVSLGELSSDGSIPLELLDEITRELIRLGGILTWREGPTAINALCRNPPVLEPGDFDGTSVRRHERTRPVVSDIRVRSTRTLRRTSLSEGALRSLAERLGGSQENLKGRTYPSPGGTYAVRSFLSCREGDSGNHCLYQLDCENSELWTQTGGWSIPMPLALNFDQAQDVPGWLIFNLDSELIGGRYGPRGFKLGCIEAGAMMQLVYEWALELSIGVLAYGGYHDDLLKQGLSLALSEVPLLAIALGLPAESDQSDHVAIPIEGARSDFRENWVVRQPGQEVSGWVVGSADTKTGVDGFAHKLALQEAFEAAQSELEERSTWYRALALTDTLWGSPELFAAECWTPYRDGRLPLPESEEPWGWAHDPRRGNRVGVPRSLFALESKDPRIRNTTGLAAGMTPSDALHRALAELVERAALGILLSTPSFALPQAQVEALLRQAPGEHGALRARPYEYRACRLWGHWVVSVSASKEAVAFHGAAADGSLRGALHRAHLETEMLELNEANALRSAAPNSATVLQARADECEAILKDIDVLSEDHPQPESDIDSSLDEALHELDLVWMEYPRLHASAKRSVVRVFAVRRH